MKKNQKGHVAVPFLITIFIGLIIIGGAAVAVYKYFGLDKKDELSEPVARAASTATYEDSHTILLILNVPEEKCSSTFVLMRSVPKEKKLVFVGIPTNTIAVIDGKQASLADSFARGGASEAVNFASQAFEVPIDRYMVFDENAMLKACDIIGGVTYTVAADIVGLKKNTEQYLNGSQMQKVMTYPLYENGEVQRAYTASSLLSSMVNQAKGERLADGLDRSFNTIINLVDSDVTSVDYKNRKVGIKDMLKNGSAYARFRVADGTVASDSFVLDGNFIKTLKEEYFAEHKEEK